MVANEEETEVESGPDTPYRVLTFWVDDDGQAVGDFRGWTPGDVLLILRKTIEEIEEMVEPPVVIFDDEDVAMVALGVDFDPDEED